MREEAELEGRRFEEPDFERAGVEEAYQFITKILKDSGRLEKDINYTNLIEDFLHEKAYDLNKFTNKS